MFRFMANFMRKQNLAENQDFIYLGKALYFGGLLGFGEVPLIAKAEVLRLA